MGRCYKRFKEWKGFFNIIRLCGIIFINIAGHLVATHCILLFRRGVKI